MNKKLKFALVSLVSLITLSSCSLLSYFFQSKVDPFNYEYEGGYLRYDSNYENYQKLPTYKDLNNANGGMVLDSIGEQKMLVVPVEFNDYPISRSSKEPLRKDINRAFFGESDETGWESVASFYHKSSYGQLMLTGEVTDWINLEKETTYLATYVETNKENPNYRALDATYFVLEEVYRQLPKSLLEEYDTDNDGYIDAIYLIYSAPNYQRAGQGALDKDVFWAYSFWYYGNDNAIDPTNTGKPQPYSYAWSSYDFMYNEYGTKKVDAHTFIHETGHILGLDDYYDYGGETSPLGGVDMMDNNIIDHNAFSKMSLGWIDPLYVTGDTDIFLAPFHSSGDAIIINDSWNKMPFDEYILLEYYQPLGLNAQDSIKTVEDLFNNRLRGFSKYGVRVYHVDARLIRNAYYKKNGLTYMSNSNNDYVNKISASYEEDGNTYKVEVAHSNSKDVKPPRNKINEQFSLIALLNASDYNSLSYRYKPKGSIKTMADTSKYADNASLWVEGDYLKLPLFNNGESVGYEIYFGQMLADGAEIQIRRF